MKSLEKQIRILLERPNRHAISLDLDTDLIAEIGLDSLALVNLVADIEKKFGIFLRDEDLMDENFRTITDILRLIEKYRSDKE